MAARSPRRRPVHGRSKFAELQRLLDQSAVVQRFTVLQLAANASARTARLPPIQRRLSLNYAVNPPGSRSPIRIGLGETVTLTSDKKVNNPQFALESGPGTLAGATFTADDQPGWVKFSAKEAGEHDRRKETRRYYVTGPTNATMHILSSQAGFFDNNGTAGAGFIATVELLPRSVSFSNLNWSEGGGNMRATGAYAAENGNAHPNGPTISVGNNNRINGQDDVKSMGIPRAGVRYSHSDWPISWRYQLPGKGWVHFVTAHHRNTLFGNGTTITSKKGAREKRRAPW